MSNEIEVYREMRLLRHRFYARHGATVDQIECLLEDLVDFVQAIYVGCSPLYNHYAGQIKAMEEILNSTLKAKQQKPVDSFNLEGLRL